jgi:hypothetical protein
VFKDERSLLVGMAFEASCISAREGTHLAQGGSAVSIVAVAALNEAFVDAVVIGLRKVCLGSCVATVAESRLRLNQQVFRFLGVMGGVAVQTADIVAGVCRTRKVPLFVFFTMATQAAGACFLLRQVLETDNLGDVATTLYMFRSGTMTGFTAVFIPQGRFEMRRGLKVLFVQIFVARLASIDPDVLSSPFGGWCDILLLPGGNSRLHQR